MLCTEKEINQEEETNLSLQAEIFFYKNAVDKIDQKESNTKALA